MKCNIQRRETQQRARAAVEDSWVRAGTARSAEQAVRIQIFCPAALVGSSFERLLGSA